MLDIKFIRENPDKVKAGLQKKGINFSLDGFLQKDQQRRKHIRDLDELKAKQNIISEEIAKISDEGIRDKKISESKEIKTRIRTLEDAVNKRQEEFENELLQIPNLPYDDVPIGKDASENKILRVGGKIPQFNFQPQDHVALGESLEIIDIERAAKVAGTRFGYLKREAALLEFALVQFAFSVLTSVKELKKIAGKIEKKYPANPFLPIVPPQMVKPEVFKKMARLTEADQDERYYLPQDNLYLVGSAEHTLGPMHMDEILDESQLPLRYVGFSTSFRREAGSYGQDTRGILRVHQFDKLEMESFTLPEDSLKEQEFFVAVQEYLMQKLEIPYRIVMLCTGDMGAPDARQIDLEAWIPSQNKYRETHTADLMTDYQARRLNTKVRRQNGKTEFAHMNDATVFAVGRTLIAILENYQQKDGSVAIPKVLRPFMGGLKIIKR